MGRTFRFRRRAQRSSLSAARLSQLTWTCADRREWLDAYAAAVRCSAVRELESVAYVGDMIGRHSVKWDRQ